MEPASQTTLKYGRHKTTALVLLQLAKSLFLELPPLFCLAGKTSQFLVKMGKFCCMSTDVESIWNVVFLLMIVSQEFFLLIINTQEHIIVC